MTTAVPPPPANLTCSITKLTPLAFPKGSAPECELTGKPAEYALVTEFETLNFASKELARVACQESVVTHTKKKKSNRQNATTSPNCRSQWTNKILLQLAVLESAKNGEIEFNLVGT